MKKVLLTFDHTHFSKGAFDFARQLNEQEPILLTGLFLPEVVIPTVKGFVSTLGDPILIPMANEDDIMVVESVKRFELECVKNGINYRVHKEFIDFAMPELQKETLFADILIVGSEAFYEAIEKGEMPESLSDVLHMGKCPVVVVPEKFKFPQTNILAYDGSDSSVFAIKQFAYLFPALTTNKTILIYTKGDSGYDIPLEEYVEELVVRHFPDLTLLRLHNNSSSVFNDWMDSESQPILISGAFGRSALSRLFKKSFIYDIICEHKFPVFLAHSKFR